MEFCQILKAAWQESWKETGIAGESLEKDPQGNEE